MWIFLICKEHINTKTMNKNSKLIKIIAFLFILTSIFPAGTTNKNYAHAINTVQISTPINFCGEKLDYTFKVSDKLIGSGIIDLTLEKNKNVCGTGNPIGILIPGKITFNGPLKGYIKNKILTLKGKVNIKGKLASLGGFKNKEDILIEIQGASLANIFKKQLHEKLAAL